VNADSLPPDEVLVALIADLEAAAPGDQVDVQALAARHGVPRRVVEDCLAGLQVLAAPAEGLPERLGPFVIRGLLARGGMGAVYRASHPALDRDVALKVLRSGAAATLGQRARFLREAEALADLRHPHVVTVHSAGQGPTGAYLALELIEGARTLTAAAADLEWRERVRLVADAARGLGYAHGRGVIHRDVKPDNLLVDLAGRVRVTDFGLARLTGGERLTQTGSMLGTAGYMAPEQLAGDTARQGPPSDVWGLGVVLYEVLTGRELFPGADNLERLVAQTKGPRPQLAVHAPELPPELELVLARALEQEPQDRYADCSALAADLDAVLAGERAGVARAARRARTTRRLALLAVLLAVAALPLLRGHPSDGGGSASTDLTREEVAQPTSDVGTVTSVAKDTRAPWSAAPGAEGSEMERLSARRWLRDNPGHPDAQRAELLFTEESVRVPLCSLVHQKAAGAVRIAFESPDVLVTAGGGRLRRWALPSGELVAKLRIRGLGRAVPLPGGDWLLSGKGGLERWPGAALFLDETERGAAGKLGREGRTQRGATWVRQLHDSGALAIGGPCVATVVDSTVDVYALEDGRVLQRLPAPAGMRPNRLTWLDGQGLLVSYGNESSQSVLTLWDVELGEPIHTQRFPAVSTLAPLRPPGLALGTHQGQVLITDATLALQRRLGQGSQDVQGLRQAFSAGAVGAVAQVPDTPWLLALPSKHVPVNDRAVKRFDLASGHGARVTPRLDAPPFTLAIAPGGDLLALGYRSGAAEVWVLPP
jgi:hypothetical protein